MKCNPRHPEVPAKFTERESSCGYVGRHRDMHRQASFLTQLRVEWTTDPNWGPSETCLGSEKTQQRAARRQALPQATLCCQSSVQTWSKHCRRRASPSPSHPVLFHRHWASGLEPHVSLVLKHGHRCPWEEDETQDTTPAPSSGVISAC